MSSQPELAKERDADGGARIALVGEARGEFLFLRHSADSLRMQLGPEAVLEVELDPDDLTPEERRTCLIPCLEPEFAEATAIPDGELVARIREAEQAFGIPNLRPLWRTDLLSWRDGVPDAVLARQAIGYLRVFGRIFRTNPALAGGFAEDGGRLIKRCFRAAAMEHGGRMVIAFPIPAPNRLLFVDQVDPSAGLPPYESFEPAPELLEQAAEQVAAFSAGQVSFSRPRDLAFGGRRLRNFLRLAYRQWLGQGPARRAYLRTFARDYLYQRTQLALLDRFADRAPRLGPAVFFPIHMGEDTQMSIRAAPYLDQRWLIAHLARHLPYGYELLVKSHPAAPGELSVIELLRIQRRFRNLRILHPSVRAQDVLARSAAMVTVNSTTGFEALMSGVPVVTLGGSLYRNRGLTYDVYDPGDLPTVLSAALSGPPPSRDGVIRLLAYCLAHCHRVVPSYADPSRENGFAFAQALASEFQLYGRQAGTGTETLAPAVQ